MLKINKSTALNGESRIDNKIVMTLAADISNETAGNSYVRQTILNQELYTANRKECRKDISDFQDAVFEIEDQFILEKTESEKEATE